MAEGQGLAAQGAELVIVHRDEPSRARPLLLPALAGDAVSRLLARLLARLPSDTHAVLLRQADGADSDAWHEDAWHALPETVRAGVLLFSGPTSFAMRRLARARVALVVAPPEQLSADQTR